ncbi:MAG TPA: acyltransferase, partial [Verrucomicrobiae bacterium]|nr:acyltransferase [Verrucomicrobiae bacterium]
MLVVLYHTELGFSGGYIGVDVFFIISGYLITSIILNDIYNEKFRILNFWERRVRRILPGLVAVVSTCLVTGWFMFFPADYMSLGRSVLCQSLLISNLFFWKTTGYFSTTSTQPLLHTWSLALEEQFYILFPFLLLALAKFANRKFIGALIGFTLISFVVGVCATYCRPTAGFYLLPARAWELSLGASLAALPNPSQTTKWIDESLSWAGLFGILFAALIYDKNTPFPGFAALVPCIGAALIIWTNSSSITFVGRMLSLRPLVWIGLISYSLYLWHWPVLIFTNYWDQGQPSFTRGLGVVFLSLALAIVTWKIIETPFRKRLVFPGRASVFTFAGVALATLFVAGHWIYSAYGF